MFMWSWTQLYPQLDTSENELLNPWISDWVQKCTLRHLSVAQNNNITNFSVCCFKSPWHNYYYYYAESMLFLLYCIYIYIFFKFEWTILYQCYFYLSKSQGQKNRLEMLPVFKMSVQGLFYETHSTKNASDTSNKQNIHKFHSHFYYTLYILVLKNKI